MKIHSFLFVVAAICVIDRPVLAQRASVKEIPVVKPEAVGMSSDKLAIVDNILDGYIRDKKMVGGLAVVARRGKICFFEEYGLADREAGRKMQKDTILRIYSMTKAVTTAAALMLHDEGRLDIEAPVSKYIPELAQSKVADGETEKSATREMTVADLMRHTAGLTYGWSKSKLHNQRFNKFKPTSPDITLAEMPERLKSVPLVFEPGTAWEYGIAIDVLGRVIEVVSKQTLDEFLRERIFAPLNMRDTGFSVPQEKLSRFAACYKPEDNGGFSVMPEERTKYLKNPAFLAGGGGLVSTARDYMRFLMMIERGGKFQGTQYLKPETVKLMTTNQTPAEAGWVRFGDEIRTGVGFGFGFCVRDKMSDWDPAGRVGEYGWGGAASTHYWVSPKDELIVITFEQIRPYRWLTEFGVKREIYDAITD